MIQKKITFVLGAGASYPYGFQLGQTLLSQIQNLGPGNVFYDLIIASGFKAKEFLEFQHELRLAGRASIDAFLETNTDFLRIGKATLALLLAHNEQELKLYNADGGENWYQYLFEIWLRGTIPADLDGQKMRFVTYNYDRSLEFYLYNAIQRLLPKTSEKTRLEIFSSFKICHIHGILDEPKFTNISDGRAYKPIEAKEELNQAIEKISIIHEYGAIKGTYSEAQRMLSDADSIVFLGFGFHAVNLERLDVKSHCQKSAVVYVSTLGVTDSEVQYHLRDLSSGPYAFEHKGNLAFIRDHLDIFY